MHLSMVDKGKPVADDRIVGSVLLCDHGSGTFLHDSLLDVCLYQQDSRSIESEKELKRAGAPSALTSPTFRVTNSDIEPTFKFSPPRVSLTSRQNNIEDMPRALFPLKNAETSQKTTRRPRQPRNLWFVFESHAFCFCR